MKIKLTHLEQLEMYIESYSESGFYYGNKEQFIKRHNELKQWIEELKEKATEKRRTGIEA